MSVSKYAVLTLTNDPQTTAALQGLLGADQAAVAVDSPAAAIARAQEDEPSLILLDTRVPGVDVGEFALKLKKDPRTSGIPLLLLAGSEQAAVPGLEAETGLPMIDSTAAGAWALLRAAGLDTAPLARFGRIFTV